LKADILGRDTHSEKIAQQRASLLRLATTWAEDGQLRPTDKDEIVFKVQTADFQDWKPLIYLIPRDLVRDRLQLVHIAQRAAAEVNEYIIPDLHSSEFEVIEL
jgi:hypothetical protein